MDRLIAIYNVASGIFKPRFPMFLCITMPSFVKNIEGIDSDFSHRRKNPSQHKVVSLEAKNNNIKWKNQGELVDRDTTYNIHNYATLSRHLQPPLSSPSHPAQQPPHLYSQHHSCYLTPPLSSRYPHPLLATPTIAVILVPDATHPTPSNATPQLTLS
ncbi:hypothetical protein ACFE04_001802 [Oxalis oulophora]